MLMHVKLPLDPDTLKGSYENCHPSLFRKESKVRERLRPLLKVVHRNQLAHGSLVPAIKTAGMLVVHGNEWFPEKQVNRPKWKNEREQKKRNCPENSFFK